MTRDEFEQIYENVHSRAVAVAQRVTGSRETAEDAVQEAAVYILQRINLNVGKEFTASYFIQLATSRAKDRLKPRGRRHGTSKGPSAELAFGRALDLDCVLYGPGED